MAELLIVVAIVAVLVAIAVPVFSAQLEKSRQATDLANTRSAYAVFQASQIEGVNPDGSAPGTESGFTSFYIYTGSGFEALNLPHNSSPVKLVSNSNPQILSDYLTMPSDLGGLLPPTETTKGCVLVVVKYGDELRNVDFTLTPACNLGF